MYTLPSGNVARTCRTIESPMTTASRSVSQRGAKRFWDEMSKTGGGEVVARGLDRVFRCCTQGLWFPGAGVKAICDDRVPGARGLSREIHGVEVVGVLAARCILTPDFPALLSVSSAGPVSQAARGSVSPRPPAPAAPNAASNVSSLAHKDRHKSAIKASNSETMLNVCMRV